MKREQQKASELMTVDIKKAEQDLKEKLAKAEQEKVDLIKQQEEAL